MAGRASIAAGSPDVLRLQNFLHRSGLPNMVVDVHADAEGRALVERTGVLAEDLPLVVCPTGPIHRCALRHLFLFIGADPNADRAQGCVETDDKGFVLTGRGVLPLETSRPGGVLDRRRASRIDQAGGGRRGEGAAVVTQIRALIAGDRTKPAA